MGLLAEVIQNILRNFLYTHGIQYINQNFTLACEKMFWCKGKVVVMGMGKSGHIGRKMAATFASTGTPSFFVHPGEAAHGDLGMVTPQD